jgi:hypothetical protein
MADDSNATQRRIVFIFKLFKKSSLSESFHFRGFSGTVVGRTHFKAQTVSLALLTSVYTVIIMLMKRNTRIIVLKLKIKMSRCCIILTTLLRN